MGETFAECVVDDAPERSANCEYACATTLDGPDPVEAFEFGSSRGVRVGPDDRAGGTDARTESAARCGFQN